MVGEGWKNHQNLARLVDFGFQKNSFIGDRLQTKEATVTVDTLIDNDTRWWQVEKIQQTFQTQGQM